MVRYICSPQGAFYMSAETKPNNPIIDKLFSVGAHFGYAPSRRHPSTAQYIFGQKGGVEIFNLEQTAECLDEALTYIKSLAAERKTVLFVGSKPEAKQTVVRAAERIGQPYVASRWIGGTLTNFSEIKKRLAKLEEHTSMREKGELAKFTKRERLMIDREITNLEVMFGGIRGLTKLPDALMVVDPKTENIAVEEARQLGIKVVAILNSDCNRSLIQHPIPANDSSAQSVALLLEEITKAYEGSLAPVPSTPAAA